MKRILVICSLLTTLSACVSPISGLQKSGSFSVENLKKDGVMVGVVISAIASETNQATQNYDAELARKLTDKFKIPVSANQCLSNDAVQQIQDSLRAQPALNTSARTAIANAKCSARYIVLSRIERDEISQRREVRQDYVFLHHAPGMLMQNEDTVVEVNFIRERKVVSAFWVIDAQTGESVWSAAITESEPAISRNSRVFPSLNMLNQVWADDYIRSLPETNSGLYPAPVAREAVWETVTKTFATQLNR
ncbi:MAG TPA: hypothetical protein VFM46_07670 [Pseudomonadales bacterium]|nr:hypothetical protein [Pseudomonadales bacterium]